MKRAISVIVISLLLTFSMIVSVSAQQVTSESTGFTNIAFSNGYYGFCIDRYLSGAYSGDNFNTADNTSAAKSNADDSDISQKLKILFTQCFNDFFVSDGNGGYVIDSEKADSSVPLAVYHFTGEQSYLWSEAKTYVETVNAYNGTEIPDEGYTLKLDNGDLVTFSFAVMEPQKEGQQSFFAYKLNVSQEAPHEHNHSDKWKYDEDNHWHECECSDKKDVAPHNGTTADCKNPSVCTECGKELAPADSNNHTGETVLKNDKPATEFEDGYTGDFYCNSCDVLLEKGTVIPATHEHAHSDKWKSDEDNHWHECECSDKKDVAPHNGTTADCKNPSVCTECGKELAPADSNNHTGKTVLKNDKPATEFENGYTGDFYCNSCDVLLEKGTVIPATHEHAHSDKWKSDEDNHWHECECGNKKDVAKHTFSNGTCSVCGKASSVKEETPDANIDFEFVLNSVIDMLPDTDTVIDSVKDMLSDIGSIDLSSILDKISGSDNKDDTTDENTDADVENGDGIDDKNNGNNAIIPDTGIESDAALAVLVLSASLALILVLMHRKKSLI